MPELPEVELVMRDLKDDIIGQTIIDVTVSDYVTNGHLSNKKTIIKENVEEFKSNILNGTIEWVGRRGKYMYMLLIGSQPQYLIAHLGMSGAFFHVNDLNEIKDRKFRNHWQVKFQFSDRTFLVYCDIRRFGELRTLSSLSMFLPFNKMAPEYDDEESLNVFLNRLHDPSFFNKSIKQNIMDSRVIPGVGNIYACESLYMSGILPTRKSKNISRKRLMVLHENIKKVFELSIKSGGSTISDYRSVNGETGKMQDRFLIYQKSHCSNCHKETSTKVIAGRNTFYCTRCQK